MRERGKTISSASWASAPDEGDAAAAVADIEAWLAARPVSKGEAAWEALFVALRAVLQRIMVNPMIRFDPVCRAILAGIEPEDTLEALNAALDGLAARVDAMHAARTARDTPPQKPVADLAAENRRARALRSFIRL